MSLKYVLSSPAAVLSSLLGHALCKFTPRLCPAFEIFYFILQTHFINQLLYRTWLTSLNTELLWHVRQISWTMVQYQSLHTVQTVASLSKEWPNFITQWVTWRSPSCLSSEFRVVRYFINAGRECEWVHGVTVQYYVTENSFCFCTSCQAPVIL